MIVFVLNYPCSKTGKSFGVSFEIFTFIFNSQLLLALNIFTDIRDTQTTFIKCPMLSFFSNNFGIDEYFFKGKPLKTPRSGGSIIQKKRKTRNRKNRKTRRRKNKRTRRRRKLTAIRTTNKHHTDQPESKS